MADHVADLTPLRNGDFRFLLIDSYTRELSGRSGDRSTPQKWQF